VAKFIKIKNFSLKMCKMADFALLEYSNLISRKK